VADHLDVGRRAPAQLVEHALHLALRVVGELVGAGDEVQQERSRPRRDGGERGAEIAPHLVFTEGLRAGDLLALGPGGGVGGVERGLLAVALDDDGADVPVDSGQQHHRLLRPRGLAEQYRQRDARADE